MPKWRQHRLASEGLGQAAYAGAHGHVRSPRTLGHMVFNRDGAEVARAEAEFDRAQADRSGVVVALEGTLAAAQIEAEDALAAAAASRPALAAANEARIARIGYAEGKFSQLDLLEAERSLTQTREAAIDSLAALHEAKVRLAHLQGDTAPYTRI